MVPLSHVCNLFELHRRNAQTDYIVYVCNYTLYYMIFVSIHNIIHTQYRRTSFNCDHLIIANCEFSLRMQKKLTIVHAIKTILFVAH